jgi:hypothetical protein
MRIESESTPRSRSPVSTQRESSPAPGPSQLRQDGVDLLMPPPSQPSIYQTPTQGLRKRQATLSSSSRSDTYSKRIADRTLQLQHREKELAIQAQELKNRETQQRLDREALQFEREQFEFRKALEAEQTRGN